jgi:prolyl oligopeptidase
MARPDTRRVDQVDDFFGTEVPDPYRWLEDPDDPEVADWARAQGAHAREYLDALPFRAEITAALDRAVRLPSSGLPLHRGERWFRMSNDGRQQQDVLLVSNEPFGPARTLIDPNQIGDDGGSSVSVAEFKPSPDGSLVAYSYSEAGSDWRTWRVRDVASGADRDDVVRWAKFTDPSWLPDGSGFVYGRFDAPDGDEYVASNRAMRLELHRLGTDQDADELVHALPDEPDITFWPEISDDGRWLTVTGTKGTEHAARIWVRELGSGDTRMHDLVPTADAAWQQIGSAGYELLMITDRDAPRNRIVALHPTDGTVRELVAQREDQLESATISNGRILVQWLHDAASRLTVHNLDGTEVGTVELPGLGTVSEIAARPAEAIAHLAWTSFDQPPSVLQYTAENAELTTVFRPELDGELVTDQVWVTSADGTKLPMFLVRRADVTRESGPHPAWLYGYGGFRIPMTPDFEPTRFAFASAGGVVAIANLRGGGEYGAPWHDAGRLANKQNVFDDMIAAAAYLADQGWTTSGQLGMTGRSNGGLLAGALITQRPDLFAAIIPEVGVLDMLRFPIWTIGWAWISDYGDPRADVEQFRTAYAYSPLHNLRAGVEYPPIMVMTSDHDDRVVPAHSMKFAAALQAVCSPEAVALLRVDAASGHKQGRSHDALIAERTDVLAFLSRHTGLKWQ